MHGNEATLLTFSVMDVEHFRLEIHVGPSQLECFGDTQSGCRQQSQEGLTGGR